MQEMFLHLLSVQVIRSLLRYRIIASRKWWQEIQPSQKLPDWLTGPNVSPCLLRTRGGFKSIARLGDLPWNQFRLMSDNQPSCSFLTASWRVQASPQIALQPWSCPTAVPKEDRQDPGKAGRHQPCLATLWSSAQAEFCNGTCSWFPPPVYP